MKYLQRLGKSLMLPVSIMPIAALLKGIGYWIDPTGWGIHNPIAALLIAAGGAIIDNLPILFAIAVAMEMSKKRDTAIVLSLSLIHISYALCREIVYLKLKKQGVDPAELEV